MPMTVSLCSSWRPVQQCVLQILIIIGLVGLLVVFTWDPVKVIQGKLPMMKSIVTTKSGETQTPLTLELIRGFNVSSHLASTSNPAQTDRSVTDTPAYCLVYNLSKPLDTAYRCVNIKLSQFKAKIKPKICLYAVSKDIHVSGSIARTGGWETDMVSRVLNQLGRYKEAGLIDIGANIGMYTIPAAKMGFKVVAVEPNLESVRRIHKAAQLSNVTNMITLVNNGISHERTTATLRLSKNNQGDTRVASNKSCGSRCGHSIRTIHMDDLLEVTTFKTAIMKIDIQSHEHKAFAHAEEILKNIFIPLIFMEWEELAKYYHHGSHGHKSADKTMVLNMINMFQKHGYTPYVNRKKLDVKRWNTWPVNIVWERKKS